MSGLEVEHAGLEWVKESFEESQGQGQGIKIYTETSKSLENSLKIRFTLKPVFNIASVRIGSEAEKAGVKVGDKVLKINNNSAYGYTIEMINALLKSEEGKTIEIEVERKNKTYTYKFRLKKII
jgi:C-terminal processing protease CtpA/Prc